MKKPPKPASNRPAPFEVRSLRNPVTSKPHPVALSTATGTNEVAGCALRRAVRAKNAAMSILIPSAAQSKPLTWRDGGDRGSAFVIETVCDSLSCTSSTLSLDSVIDLAWSGLFMYKLCSLIYLLYDTNTMV